jgi:small subunit ribosomal protein S8
MSTTTTDPVADMLTRIRNALAVNKGEVQLPHSNLKESVARLLAANHFIEGVDVDKATVGKTLTIRLGDARISEIVRLSKPGRRAYVRAAEIPVVKRGRGVVIISTSKGMMTGDQARAEHIGGELICKVY